MVRVSFNYFSRCVTSNYLFTQTKSFGSVRDQVCDHGDVANNRWNSLKLHSSFLRVSFVLHVHACNNVVNARDSYQFIFKYLFITNKAQIQKNHPNPMFGLLTQYNGDITEVKKLACIRRQRTRFSVLCPCHNLCLPSQINSLTFIIINSLYFKSSFVTQICIPLHYC